MSTAMYERRGKRPTPTSLHQAIGSFLNAVVIGDGRFGQILCQFVLLDSNRLWLADRLGGGRAKQVAVQYNSNLIVTSRKLREFI
jgi:hypothetical protein